MPTRIYPYVYHENNCPADVCNVDSKDHVTTWASKQGRKDMKTNFSHVETYTQKSNWEGSMPFCSWLTPQNGGHGKRLYLELDCASVIVVMKNT